MVGLSVHLTRWCTLNPNGVGWARRPGQNLSRNLQSAPTPRQSGGPVIARPQSAPVVPLQTERKRLLQSTPATSQKSSVKPYLQNAPAPRQTGRPVIKVRPQSAPAIPVQSVSKPLSLSTPATSQKTSLKARTQGAPMHFVFPKVAPQSALAFRTPKVPAVPQRRELVISKTLPPE